MRKFFLSQLGGTIRSYQTTLFYALYGAFAIILLGVTTIAHAIHKVDVDSGTLVAESANGDVIPMPLVSTDVGINVTGPIARTTVHQTFQNDSDQWVEAIYFPHYLRMRRWIECNLSFLKNAAVLNMRLLPTGGWLPAS